MTNHNATNLIFRNSAMQHQTKRHQHPRQIRRREHQQAQKAQPRIRIPPRPDIHQTATERRPQKRHPQHGRNQQQNPRGIHQQPGKMRRGPARRFLQQPRIALEEEDVEEEINGQRTKVQKRSQDPPILKWSFPNISLTHPHQQSFHPPTKSNTPSPPSPTSLSLSPKTTKPTSLRNAQRTKRKAQT